MAIATLERIRNTQTPGTFDYRLLMATRSIFCSGWIRSSDEIRLVAEPERAAWQGLLFLPEQVRQETARFLDTHFDREVAGLYQALLIGSVVNISPKLMEEFKDNGCFHALSISGLHLSLLALFSVSLWMFLLKRSRWLLLHCHVSNLALLLTAPLLLIYTWIAGCNVPAIRSLVTALLVLFAVVLRRQREPIHLIAAAALIVLIMTPLALFTPSFQLSFAAVLAINLIYPRLPLFKEVEENTEDFRGGFAAWHRTKTLGIKACRGIVSMLYVSVAATAGTLPILLYHFNRFSLIGPVMNLLIEPPLCLWALPCGLLAIPLIPIAPDAAMLLFQIGRPGIDLTVWLADAAAGFPYASVWTITPTLYEIVLFFLMLWLLLRQKKTRWQMALASFVSLLLTASFSSSLWYPRLMERLSGRQEALRLNFLDVGQGTSTLLQLPDASTVLLDGGSYQGDPKSAFDPGQNLIAPFLWQQRIWRLDDLIVTHPHQDHYNGLPFVAAHFKPQRVFINGDPGEESAYAPFLDAVRAQGGRVQIAQAGDVLRQGDKLRLTCLGMTGLLENGNAWSTNERSLVVGLRYGARSFLFPGDIGCTSEARLLERGADLHADVLLAPHHGSAYSGSPAFLDAINPAAIVISARPRRQQERQQVSTTPLTPWQGRDRLGDKNPPLLLTSDVGTVTCWSDGQQLRLRTHNGKEFVLDEVSGRVKRAGER